MVTKIKTGHIYRNSAHETSSSCGNCDGAKCDTCVDIFDANGQIFDSFEEAQKADTSMEAMIKTLIPELPKEYKFSSIPEDYDYHVIDNKLYLRVWKQPSFKDDTDYGNRSVLCNENSPLYAQKLEGAIERLNMYKECTCTDKQEECSLGCPDKICYREMKAGKRTEKKWYM